MTTYQVIIALLGVLLTTYFAMMFMFIRTTRKINKHMGLVEYHMKESDKRFFTLAKDFKKHLAKCPLNNAK